MAFISENKSGTLYSRSPLMRRPNIKPRGFAGDSEMMSMVYRNAYEGETTFGKLLHKYAVGLSTGHSVRYRRKLIPEMLNKAQETTFSCTRGKNQNSIGCLWSGL